MPIPSKNFKGYINDERASEWRRWCAEQVAGGAEAIQINLDSEGGDILPSFDLAAYLRSLSIPVHICNVGEVASMAFIVFISATGKRSTLPVALFTLHRISFRVEKDEIFEASLLEMLDLTDEMQKAADEYAALTARYTQIRHDEILPILQGKAAEKLMVLDASDATTLGVVNELARSDADEATGLAVSNGQSGVGRDSDDSTGQAVRIRRPEVDDVTL